MERWSSVYTAGRHANVARADNLFAYKTAHGESVSQNTVMALFVHSFLHKSHETRLMLTQHSENGGFEIVVFTGSFGLRT